LSDKAAVNFWLRGSGLLLLTELASCNALKQTSQCLAASQAVRDALVDVKREIDANPSATPETYARVAVRYQALQTALLELKAEPKAKPTDSQKSDEMKSGETAKPVEKPPETQFSKLVGRVARDVAGLAAEADEFAAVLRQQREASDATAKSQAGRELENLRSRRERTEESYSGSLEKLSSYCKTGR
jgi:hypothetical protein